MQSAAPLLDYLAGQQARDAVLASVERSNQDWFNLAYLQLEQFARHGCPDYANTEHGLTGEEIVAMLKPHCGKPHHSNAIGALICKAVRRGLLVHTGQYRKMKNVGSHARRTPVYQLIVPSN
jgi:hypothetical protein